MTLCVLRRTAVPGCEEDEADLQRIALRMEMFRALVRGFLQVSRGSELMRMKCAIRGVHVAPHPAHLGAALCLV
jgi:hypothetical protein